MIIVLDHNNSAILVGQKCPIFGSKDQVDSIYNIDSTYYLMKRTVSLEETNNEWFDNLLYKTNRIMAKLFIFKIIITPILIIAAIIEIIRKWKNIKN